MSLPIMRPLLLTAVLLLPTACSVFEDEDRLEGTRIPVRGERSTSIVEPVPEGEEPAETANPGPALSFPSADAIVAPTGGAPLP
ncbi:MAG: hypothetical protein AAFP67_10115, partial [Pseudomonadota bacterium]